MTIQTRCPTCQTTFRVRGTGQQVGAAMPTARAPSRHAPIPRLHKRSRRAPRTRRTGLACRAASTFATFARSRKPGEGQGGRERACHPPHRRVRHDPCCEPLGVLLQARGPSLDEQLRDLEDLQRKHALHPVDIREAILKSSQPKLNHLTAPLSAYSSSFTRLDDPIEGEAAAKKLSEIATEQNIPHLLKGLECEQVVVRQHCLDALERLHTPQSATGVACASWRLRTGNRPARCCWPSVRPAEPGGASPGSGHRQAAIRLRACQVLEKTPCLRVSAPILALAAWDDVKTRTWHDAAATDQDSHREQRTQRLMSAGALQRVLKATDWTHRAAGIRSLGLQPFALHHHAVGDDTGPFKPMSAP